MRHLWFEYRIALATRELPGPQPIEDSKTLLCRLPIDCIVWVLSAHDEHRGRHPLRQLRTAIHPAPQLIRFLPAFLERIPLNPKRAHLVRLQSTLIPSSETGSNAFMTETRFRRMIVTRRHFSRRQPYDLIPGTKRSPQPIGECWVLQYDHQ